MLFEVLHYTRTSVVPKVKCGISVHAFALEPITLKISNSSISNSFVATRAGLANVSHG